jgi:lipopolysaccharide/colanic/teichoic acid biosynthesis glycosyltransferase
MTSVKYARTMMRRVDPRVRTTFGAEGTDDPLRRALNITVAAVGIVLVAPLMVGIALLIKLTSPGPVFYTQPRVGVERRSRGQVSGNNKRHRDFGGRLFNIYKFRTMVVTAQGSGNGTEVWATPNDPRVTPLGRILRLYRLDELPQLINVLRGDMNVVGPRPEQPAIFAQLRQQIESYQERQRVRPGITGWAQVNQSYDRSVGDVHRKVAYDLQYIARQSVLEDVKILMRTLPVVLGKRGAW